MATKKGSKSSKTAHVLNVLSGTKQEAPAEEDKLTADEPQAREAEQAVPPPRPPVRAPILEMARANDEILSDQIQQLLEEDWEQEEAPEEATWQGQQMEESQTMILDEAEDDSGLKAEEVPSGVKLTVEEREPSKQEPDVLEEEQQTPTVQEEEHLVSTIPEPSSSSKSEAPTPPLERSKEDDFCPVNVMQVLVEEKCMRYINMFSMCDCSRCIADVKALALSNLIPKYLVMRRSEVVPMLTVYEGRLNAALTAQLIQACKIVMDNPRH